MTTYRVVWEIDIEADCPEEAADNALKIQRDPSAEATCFDVWYGPNKVLSVDLLTNTEIE
jgi:hypothetical protein